MSVKRVVQTLFLLSIKILSQNLFPVQAFIVEISRTDGRTTDGQTPEATTIVAPADGQGAKKESYKH